MELIRMVLPTFINEKDELDVKDRQSLDQLRYSSSNSGVGMKRHLMCGSD